MILDVENVVVIVLVSGHLSGGYLKIGMLLVNTLITDYLNVFFYRYRCIDGNSISRNHTMSFTNYNTRGKGRVWNSKTSESRECVRVKAEPCFYSASTKSLVCALSASHVSVIHTHTHKRIHTIAIEII